MSYAKEEIREGVFVVYEEGRNYKRPFKACTGAFDTETQVYFDGKKYDQKTLFKKIRNLKTDDKRKRVSSVVWAWQCYDEDNGFFMTNDFDEFLLYCCRVGYKFLWCYNATFDFSQIDYEVLAKGADKWKPHEKKGDGDFYDKGQAYAYESVHSDMGARYAYKLWYPYRNKDGHDYVHAIEFRDFMKFVAGGLKNVFEGLDVRDADGVPVRKLRMDYQAVDIRELRQDEIEYCVNDVKGLYYAVKSFNEMIEELSAGECHIYGDDTNLMTAGGFAKREMLRAMYPNKSKYSYRKKSFQNEHPINAKQDEFLRANHLYRGGITFVNPAFKGKTITAKMYRYDVNSEYPFAMSIIDDLVGRPIRKDYQDFLKMSKAEREKYEVIYCFDAISGRVKKDYLGVWYDPFKRKFVDFIDEEGRHLIFKREFDELRNWYDEIEYSVEFVLLCEKGGKRYAEFINRLYALKAQAKKDGNKVLQAVVKLLLNSSYGKLSERIVRTATHYERSPETGAIHLVRDGEETDETNIMSVLIGSLITATARVYILSKIREIHEGQEGGIRANFIYIDTDSIHTLTPYGKADAYALGGLKLEAVCDACKYIAPKTYIDIEKINKDGTIDLPDDNGKGSGFEVHCKGINTASFVRELRKKQKGKKNGKPTLELLARKMEYGEKYIVLVSMNVKGGKALLPTEKYLARVELKPSGEDLYYNNMCGLGYLGEA